MSDRTVHATRLDGWEIVRYNKAGKWWSEYSTERFPLPTVRDAAEWAYEKLDSHFAGRPGGRRFDARLWELVQDPMTPMTPSCGLSYLASLLRVVYWVTSPFHRFFPDR